MYDQPLVSIVTINWNSTTVTCEFLSSIRKNNSYRNIEVIVVDNASDQNPTSFLVSSFPSVRVIRNSKNLGFSGGNNVGIKAAAGDYIFVVNNDTEFTPGLIESLLSVFQRKEDAGIVCPKFHYYFNKGVIEFAGYNRINIFTGRNHMIGKGEYDNGQYDVLTQTHYAHGGGMMVSRKALEEVGSMPEEFFLYYEEIDWSVQFKKKGYHIYFQPEGLIYHKESMTTGKNSPLKTYYLTRNRILFMRRNISFPKLSVFFVYFTLIAIPKNCITYLLNKQPDHLRSFWKGIAWHFNTGMRVKRNTH